MTSITITTASPNELAKLVDGLWNGEISEAGFVKNAHQIGASVARIEWELEQIKQHDQVLA